MKLISRDVWLFLLIGCACFAFSCFKFLDAFPTASINLKVSKQEAIRIAQKYSQLAGFYDIFDSSVYFSGDKRAETFLEYELGVTKANQVMRDEVPVWYWDVHFENARHSRDFDADIGTDGKLHAFKRNIPDDLKLDSLSADEAKEKATRFMESDMGINLADWKLISERQTDLPSRMEHAFIWEDEKNDFAGGHVRVNATVSGNILSCVDRYLHVPEAFTHKYDWIRAQNLAYSNLSFIGSLLFALALPFVFVRGIIHHQIRYKFMVVCGVIAAAVSFVSSLNRTSSIIASSQNWSPYTYLFSEVLRALPTALLIGLGSALFFATIEIVYRSGFPEHTALEKLFDGSALNSVSLFKASLIGMSLFGLWVGYQVAFYLIGKQFGFWLPLDVNDSSVLNSFSPAWDAVSVGIKASTVEEMGFRVFMLVIVQRLTRSFWIANIVQSMLWGFGHCNYSVEPPYARGLELTTTGLLAGWILRQYGIVPLILCHYAFDVYVSVTPLLCSPSALDKLAVAAGMMPPVVLGLLAYLRLRKIGPADEEAISNASVVIEKPEPHLQQEEPLPELPVYEPLGVRSAAALALSMVASMALCLLPVPTIGPEPVLKVNRDAAVAIARHYFAAHFDIKDKQAVAWLSDDAFVPGLQYVFEKTGRTRTRELEQNIEPRLVWNVRLFQPGNASTLSIKIDGTGSPFSADISMDETVAGAQLSREAAQELARGYLKEVLNGKYSDLVFRDVAKTDHPSRTDYKFVVEVPKLRVKEAPFQLIVRLVGDQPSNFDRLWRTPESWNDAREREKHRTTMRKVIDVASIVLSGLLLLNVGYWLLQIFQKNRINWQVIVAAGALAGLLDAIGQANDLLMNAYKYYVPATPLETHWVELALRVVGRFSIVVIATCALSAAITASYTRIFGRHNLIFLARLFKPLITDGKLWADALLLGGSAAAVATAIFQFGKFVRTLISPEVQLTDIRNIVWLEQASPAVASLQSALVLGLFALLGFVAYECWRKYYQVEPPQIATVALVVIALHYAGDTNLADFAMHCASMLAVLVIAYGLAKKFSRTFPAAFFFAVFFFEVGHDFVELYYNARQIHAADLAVLGSVLVLPAIWLLVFWLVRGRPRKASAGERAGELGRGELERGDVGPGGS